MGHVRATGGLALLRQQPEPLAFAALVKEFGIFKNMKHVGILRGQPGIEHALVTVGKVAGCNGIAIGPLGTRTQFEGERHLLVRLGGDLQVF